nr:hypothetical protein [uncultured Cohaesibacter sp.]
MTAKKQEAPEGEMMDAAAAKEAAAKEPTVVVTMLRGYFPTPEERGDDERRKWPKGEEITLAKSVANSLKERYLAEITRV